MKKYWGLISVSIMLTVLVTTQSSFGGKLESFIGKGEFVTAICGTDEIEGNSFNIELDINEVVQINCGIEQSAQAEVGTNVTITEGDSVKITCVPPAISGQVIVPISMNNTQKVLCTTTATTD